MQKGIGASYIGNNSENEDSILINDKLGLYVVADGVGGMRNAQLASKIACETLENSIEVGMNLTDAIKNSHYAIQDYSHQYLNNVPMSTTIAAVLIKNGNYEIAWIGSSRVYVWDGALSLLTLDDSVAELLFANGIIDLKKAKKGKFNKIITQALGLKNHDLVVHSNKGFLSHNQILLLTTDGFHLSVDESNIMKIINKHQGDLNTIGENLFHFGTQINPNDDMSYILVKSEINYTHIKTKMAPNVFRVYSLF